MPVNACTSGTVSADPDGYDLTSHEPESCAPPPPPALALADATRSHTEVVPLYRNARALPNGDVTAGVAALKGHDARSGIDIEVFSVSGETGPAVNGAQVAMARMGVSGQPAWHPEVIDKAAASFEVFTAHVAIGTQNPDGSLGFGVSVGTAVVGVEVSGSVFDGAVSGSIGASAGLTFEGAIGVRDADKDGRPELCGRLGVAVVTGDICLEWPF
jgi:hypothetical protein